MEKNWQRQERKGEERSEAVGPAGWAPSLLAVTTPEGTPTPPAPQPAPNLLPSST